MVVLLKSTPFEGMVTQSCHGPFHTEKEAVDWAVENWEGQPEWVVMDVQHPSDYNEEEDDMGDEPDAKYTKVDPAELERLIRQAEKSRESQLPKEILLDLSEIPVGI